MSSSAASRPAIKFQALSDLFNLKRSALLSHYRKQVDDLADDVPFPALAAFLPRNLWPWIKGYGKYVFGRKHPFAAYPHEGDQGIYRLAAADGGQTIKISIAGDWGTGTEEAFKVASAMSRFAPDYTIHLGDVYYVGDDSEVDENCLGTPADGYAGVSWPIGSVGSFAMNGNHEMYANGNAYFDRFLPALGIPASQDKRQLASFFCLQNDVWRIVGLDTGYNSVGLPILGQIPLIKKIPFIGADCKLEDKLIEWLSETVKRTAGSRATIVLTHHPLFSAFGPSYPKPGKQLARFFSDREVIWLWAHEHRMAVYGKYKDQNGITTYSRCLGHGGMPVEFKSVRNKELPLAYFDARVYKTYGKTRVGFNGFLNISLRGEEATFDYRDLNDNTILNEKFVLSSDGAFAHAFLTIDPELSKAAAGAT